MDNLIVFEGNEKLGKTTVALEVCKKLGNYRYQKFPNEENATGKIIREILQEKRSYEPYSFQALNTIDKQITDLKGNVICDRFTLSQIVYGVLDNVSIEFLEEICLDLPEPDLMFIFTGDPFCKDEEIFNDNTDQIGELYETFLSKHEIDKTIIRIEANKPLEETITEICDYIWEFEK
jgi:thymidylate kinase